MQTTLEIEVVQQRPCKPNFGACMGIETTRASALQLPPRHVCDDARARHAKTEVGQMIGEALRGGFQGAITAHFPPGTYGAHVVDDHGQLVPVANLRAPRPAPTK